MNNEKLAMSEIIGNDALKKRLSNDIMSNSLSHAYIIEGPEGSGKHLISLMTAAALSCENKNDTSVPIPCLTCPTCKKILELKSPDVIIQGTDGKATFGVDIARFLKEDVHTLPNDLEHKVYILEDADKMTPQAQNALLLTLEEPPSFIHFFLLCKDSSAFLETIRSRAPIFKTETINEDKIDEFLCTHDRRAAQMKLTSPEEYYEIIKASEGGIGRAIKLLDPKDWKPVKELRQLVCAFIELATSRNKITDTVSLISKLTASKRDLLTQQLNLILVCVRDLILLKKCESPTLIFFSDENKAIEISDRVSLSFLYTLEGAIYTAIEENKRNANVKLLLTKMLISAELI
jgi:DNA polymerase-3 subunit delta'